MKKSIWLFAGLIGIANAIVLDVFEFVGVDVTNWLWNDVLNTDEYRLRVIPVALGLGLIMTVVIRYFKSKRVVPPEDDPLEVVETAPTKLSTIWEVLVIGAMCLLAGGSIGPEASLMIASAGIGAFAATRWKFQSEAKQLLILASIGALLVAFIGSLVLALIPIAMLAKTAKQKKQKLRLRPVAITLVASLTSFVTIHALHRLGGSEGSVGYGTAPTMPAFHPKDLLVAILIGFVSGFLGLALNWLIRYFYQYAKKLDAKNLPAHDWVIGLVFSLGLGVLYLIGGQTIQFSGSIGSHLLASEAANYGALALLGLVVTKLLATAWSKGTGYRGGLVFPSIYVGVAIGLLVGETFSSLSGAGALVGGIAGMLAAVIGSPVMGAIFLLAVLPYRLWLVGLCAVIGVTIFSKLRSGRLEPSL